MDGARLLLGGAVALLALGAVVVLAISGNRFTVAETPSEESATSGRPAAEKPCDETSDEGLPDQSSRTKTASSSRR
jgi:hypothetical protein